MAHFSSFDELENLTPVAVIDGQIPICDAQILMAYPFFSLSKTPRLKPIDYKSRRVMVQVDVGGVHGLATISSSMATRLRRQKGLTCKAGRYRNGRLVDGLIRKRFFSSIRMSQIVWMVVTLDHSPRAQSSVLPIQSGPMERGVNGVKRRGH